MALLAITRSSRNIQNASRTPGPLTIGPMSYSDQQGNRVWIRFKNVDGNTEEGEWNTSVSFPFPEAKWEGDDSNPTDLHNYDCMKTAYEKGLLNFVGDTDFSFEKASDRVATNKIKRQKRAEAEAIIKAIERKEESVATSEFISLCTRLGFANPGRVPVGELIDWLYELADSAPETIIREINNPLAEMYTLAKDAIDAGIISRGPNGYFYNGRDTGYNEAQIASFLDSNSDIAVAIKNQLSPKTIPTRTAPQADFEEALAEQEKLDALKKQQQQEQPVDVYGVIEKGVENKVIETKNTGAFGRQKKYLYNGEEFVSPEELAEYLNDNPAVYDLLKKVLAV